MDRTKILTTLQQLTGNLKPSERTSNAELRKLQNELAENLAGDPAFKVAGSRMHHEASQHLDVAVEEAPSIRHLDEILDRIDLTRERVAPLVFRRETEFQNALIGNSTPEWANGMAVAKSYGPFIDENDLHVWFDFFVPTRLVRVYLKGNSSPSLLIPVSGLLTPRQNYNIQGGSVWIASSLITPDPASQGFYTGLRVKRGTLELTADSEISNETIVVKPGTTATLSLELDQIVVPPGTGEAGLDADHVKLKLPDIVTLRFSAGGGKLRSNEAACRVFNCRTDFRFANSTPIWLAPFNQILVPYHVTAGGDAPDTFTVKTSESKLCQFAGSAKINAGSGWLIPAAKVDPQYLGEAAGTGALLIGVNKKIAANWKGLAESETLLKQPGIVVQPGMVTVADFFAENLHGKQRWILWKNRTTKHHSDITLGFGKSFPFVFVSSSSGSESVLFFCKHKASLDRPVDANGSPFRIESTIALASIVQNGTDFRAFLYDNDLLFDGDPKKKGATDKLSIILRNAFFNVTRPYSLFLTGKLENDNEITKGMVVLLHAIYLYLPTLPDPYVASYTGLIRGRLAGGFGGLRLGLAGFVKWPNPGEVVTAEDGTIDETAYVYFKFAPVDQSLVFNPPSGVNETPNAPATKNFQVGVRLFNRNVIAEKAISRATLPLMTAENALRADASMVRPDSGLRERIGRSVDATDFRSAVDDLEANPLLRHVPEMRAQVHEVMRTGVENMEARSAGDVTFGKTFAVAQPDSPSVSRGARGLFLPPDSFTLLDVSSRADQMGVSFGTAIRVERDPHGDANIRGVNALAGSTAFGSDLPLQISNMDVVAVAQNVRAVTLPQISWELISNIPLPIEGPPDPNDLITVTPGILVYDNDGIATRIFSESPYLVPVTPRSVTKHFVKEFNDENVPRQLHSVFTLPFALIAQADFERDISLPVDRNTRFTFNRPQFPEVRGGLQIKTLAPTSLITDQKPSFDGWTFQLDDNIKWFLFGIPITGSTLGNTVKTIFNNIFRPGGVDPKVPLEHIEFSGYGATIFSNWLNAAAAIADVSQAKFDVLVGRTAHEVVQVRSMMFTKTGCVRVVRTITLMRSPNGYVFRSDSGWKAESDAFFDSDYHIAFGNEKKLVDDTFEFHRGAVNGMSNVREIRDFPAGGFFAGSFSLNQSGLPQKLGKTLLSDWKPSVFANLGSLDEQLPVLLQPVVFDADVHFNDVVIGGVRDPQRNDFKVQTRKSLGYVQLAPSRVMIPPFILAQLLRFQNGSIGGPVDCTLDIAKSKQTIRLARVDLNPAKNGVGKDVFSCAARGSLILPPDGSWSVVTQKTDTRDVKPLDQGKTVPLIRREGEPNFRIADPADVIQPTSNNNYGVLHSTGTQKLLFDTPQFSPNVQKLKSANTYFADAYKLLNAKSVFPNLANALALTNAEKEIEVLGNGLMKMAERTLNLGNLLPGNYEYPFVNEPGILKIYVKYKKKSGDDGSFKLGIDSLAGDIEKKWKAALSDIRIVVDLGPFQEIMWVEGNMNASSGIKTKFDIPHLQFGPVLDPAIKILQVLAMLSGDDFDREMSVGMSNTPDSWEYKFNCSKEIPVIKFPSPFQLSLNPNPPLKLEAGIKVGFYFNEVISIPTDLKQLVPACGAYVDFYGRLQVMCFTLAAASVYAVGQVNLGIAADTKAGISLRMKFGFGVEIVVGLPVVGNVSVLYMCEVEIGISSASIRVGAFLLFRGQAEICGGLVGVCIQIEAGGAIERTGDKTECIAQVTFAIDITVLWVIDISFEDTWEESRQIA